jgi:hypothetical protein
MIDFIHQVLLPARAMARRAPELDSNPVHSATAN